MAKRRKIEAEQRKNAEAAKSSVSLQPGDTPAPPTFHALPPRPNFDSFEDNANRLGLGAPASPDVRATAIAAIGGTASDWVNNRREIRMANLSAAEMLKAEMMSALPANPAARRKHMAQLKAVSMQVDVVKNTETTSPSEALSSQSEVPVREAIDEETPVQTEAAFEQADAVQKDESPAPMEVSSPQLASPTVAGSETTTTEPAPTNPPPEANQSEEPLATDADDASNTQSSPHGVKRKADEVESAEGEEDEDAIDLSPDDEEEEDFESFRKNSLKRQVKPDGSVQQEDAVRQVLSSIFEMDYIYQEFLERLFEPGYKERYYKHKFGVDYSDEEFRKE